MAWLLSRLSRQFPEVQYKNCSPFLSVFAT